MQARERPRDPAGNPSKKTLVMKVPHPTHIGKDKSLTFEELSFYGERFFIFKHEEV